MVDRLQDLPSPRKKMRKGTRSCVECRRRKTRCTLDPDWPGICKECRSRGSTCLDQEHAQADLSINAAQRGVRPYSLRERVVQLENVVQRLLGRLDAIEGSSNSSHLSSRSLTGNAKVTNSMEPVSLPKASGVRDDLETTVDKQMANAPVLQLFGSCSATRTVYDQVSLRLQDSSPKATTARTSLMSLLPPAGDITKLVGSSLMWWSAWQINFPEICEKCFVGVTTKRIACENPMPPAEVAKALLCLCISLEQLPNDYNYGCLSVPLRPREFTERCIIDIERLIVHDDDFASTLPGIECQLLLTKYYINQGGLRKAWLTTRRAIDFAQLVGIHLSTAKPPLVHETTFDRRLKIWCSASALDRFLSLILGLPYAVPDALLAPQIDLSLRSRNNPAYKYMSRLSLVLGKLVDRNPEPPEQLVSSVFSLDEELEDMIKLIPDHWWRGYPTNFQQTACGYFFECLMLRFIHNVVRAFLHLPYMVKCVPDTELQRCRLTALESSRESLFAYRELRSMSKSYLSHLVDFLSFTMAALLAVNAVRYSGMAPDHADEQGKLDIDLVRATADTLAQAGTGKGGTLTSDYSETLHKILNCLAAESETGSLESETFTVSLPYFGAITVSPGNALAEQLTLQTSPVRSPSVLCREKPSLGQPHAGLFPNSTIPGDTRRALHPERMSVLPLYESFQGM